MAGIFLKQQFKTNPDINEKEEKMFTLTTEADTTYPQIINLNTVTNIYIYKRTFGMLDGRAEFLVRAGFNDEDVTLSVHKTLEEAESEIHRLYEMLRERK